MNNMQSSTPIEASPQALGGSIARSRSRYKGARPNKSFTTAQGSASLSTEQSQLCREKAPPMRERQPSNAYHAVPTGLLTRLKQGSPKKVVDLEVLNAGVIKPRSLSRESQSKTYTRNDTSIDHTHVQPAVQASESFRAKEAHLEPKPREQQAKLQSRQLQEPVLKRPSVLTKKSFTQRIAEQTKGHLRSRSREELKKTISAPVVMESPQSIIHPAFDAPLSAVNAGERRVAVEYSRSRVPLPVTPSTTPEDILRLASEHMPDLVDTRNMIVVESYKQLGLERPLRKYEHIRDVLNSWDNDTQNTLLIIPSPAAGKNEDLELDCVSKFQPVDTSVSIYHSQRPGHWDKRWVTLRTDGQIVVAKKEGGEASNICHLSDFDIYIPTARQLSKKIKPPRKLCFTVKSQQKSSMFMSTVNYVHFFSTSDKALATSWYKAVQEWRSWYLVNVMGKGQRDSQIPRKESVSGNQRPPTDSQLGLNHHGRLSAGSKSRNVELAGEDSSQRLPVRNRSAPPVSLPKLLTKDWETASPTSSGTGPPMLQTSSRRESEPEPFAATSLLGRTYTQRQKAQQSREASQNGAGLAPSLPRAPGLSESLKRAPSQRKKTKPLVDLTPQYQEPPQHARKGKGVLPEQIPAGGLVEIATSPEALVEIPPATTWQRPTTSGRDNVLRQEIQRSRTMSRDRSTGPSPSVRQASTSPEKGALLFTSGLLASDRKGQGCMRTGRGIMTGDREAKAPMLDVAEQSSYAPGSLLARAEKHNGGRRPVIERGKRNEIDASIREGF